MRVARRNSGNFRNLSDSFAGCWDKFCVISTPRACLDSNATLTQSRASVTPYDLRSARFPEKKKLNSVRLARQNSGNFAILSWDFLRKFCNISTPDAFLFGSKRYFDLIKSFISVCTRFAHRTLAECTIFSCARRAEIPEIYQNLRDLDAARLLFLRIRTHG